MTSKALNKKLSTYIQLQKHSYGYAAPLQSQAAGHRKKQTDYKKYATEVLKANTVDELKEAILIFEHTMTYE